MKAEEIIKKAKEHLILFHEFFDILSLQVGYKPDYDIVSMETDGKIIYYNPDYVESLTVPRCATGIAHEICHILSFHHLRLENKIFEDWNKACDYAINPILLESKMDMPEDYLLSNEFAGMDAEHIYNIIKTEQEDETEQEGNEESDEDNEQTDAESNKSDESLGCDNSGDEKGDKECDNESEDAETNGTGESENQGDSEGEIKPEQFGSLRAPAPDVDIKEHKDDIAQMAIQAAMQTEQAGTLTSGLKTIIQEIREPKQDWRDILPNALADYANNDYNWIRPNRNYIQRGIYVPSLHSLSLGAPVFAVDTSCSVNEEVLADILADIREASEWFSENFLVIQCDTRIQEAKEYDSEDIEDIEILGRGGTRFSPVFEYIKQNDIDPKMLIYLTDGRCYETIEEPDYPVLWLIYDNPNFKEQFGEVIHVN